NTAQGFQSLFSNTTGLSNTAQGYYSLYSNTTGNYNTATGYYSLQANTTGERNTAQGRSSLYANTTGDNNTAQGYLSLYSNTTGTQNTATGYSSLYSNTTGNYNTAVGYEAGRYQSDSSTNPSGSNSVYIGYNTKASGSVDAETNQIVIGSEAVGLGSNTAVLGNDSITTTALKGNVGIGTATPTYKLDINEVTTGNLIVSRFKHNQGGVVSAIQLENRAGAVDSAFDINWGLNSSGNQGTVGVVRTNLPVAGGSEMYFKTSYGEAMRIDGSGNVGIGTDSPSDYAGTADNLVVNGGAADSGITIATDNSHIGNLFFADGTTGSEAYAGLIQYQHSSNLMKFGTSGVPNKMVIDSSGNVGIGTTTPDKLLHIASDVATEASLKIVQAGQNNWILGLAASSADFRIADTNLGSPYVIIQAVTGYVGIGTTTPNEALTVSGSISASGDLYLDGKLYDVNNGAGTSGQILSSTGTGIDWINASTASVDGTGTANYISRWVDGDTITTSSLYETGSKVGIGTTTPSSKLHISGGVGSLATGLAFGDGDTGFYEASDDSLWFASVGVDRWKTDSVYLLSTLTSGKATIRNSVASATNPVFTFYSDLDTGIGKAGADTGSLIAGGTNVVNWYPGGVDVEGEVTINGKLKATQKSFVISTPSGGELEYGSLEGQENGVYYRGKLEKESIIGLPKEWEWLIDSNTITVQLTPFGNYQELYVEKTEDNKVFINTKGMFKSKNSIKCYYIIHAERKDVKKLK
ncbi:hypothetical protein HN682_05715, partial [Candidatus Peregrinibacteria bacterium]|nr:hypothetical protein [Candidatus Peregrinibacteria bacterium]